MPAAATAGGETQSLPSGGRGEVGWGGAQVAGQPPAHGPDHGGGAGEQHKLGATVVAENLDGGDHGGEDHQHQRDDAVKTAGRRMRQQVQRQYDLEATLGTRAAMIARAGVANLGLDPVTDEEQLRVEIL